MAILNTTIIAVMILMGAIFLISSMIRIESVKWPIAVMFFACAIAVTRLPNGQIYGSWMLPIQSIRAELYLIGGILVLVGLIFHIGLLNLSRTSVQGWLLLAIGLYQGLLRFYHDSAFEGIKTLGGATFTILPLIICIPILLRKLPDWHDLLRFLAFVDLAWLAVVLIQVAVDHTRLTIGWNDRFVGAGGNPQHVATFLSLMCLIQLWLFQHDYKRRFRLLWLALFGLNALFLIATGSRTGIGMFFIGTMFLMHRRIGKFAILLPFVAISMWGAYKFLLASGFQLDFERVTSLENTRDVAWSTLLSEGMSSPLFGNGMFNVENSENSYLLAFAAFGIGALLLLVTLLFYSIAHCLMLYRMNKYSPRWQPLLDLCIAFNAMFFAGAMFEGYIILRATPMAFGLAIISAMSASIVYEIRRESSPIFVYGQPYIPMDEIPDDSPEFNMP